MEEGGTRSPRNHKVDIKVSKGWTEKREGRTRRTERPRSYLLLPQEAETQEASHWFPSFLALPLRRASHPRTHSLHTLSSQPLHHRGALLCSDLGTLPSQLPPPNTREGEPQVTAPQPEALREMSWVLDSTGRPARSGPNSLQISVSSALYHPQPSPQDSGVLSAPYPM